MGGGIVFSYYFLVCFKSSLVTKCTIWVTIQELDKNVFWLITAESSVIHLPILRFFYFFLPALLYIVIRDLKNILQCYGICLTNTYNF